MPSRTAIVIAGPTASGKSALAIDLAQKVGGVVINADAMQVYADLRMLTARPSEDDEAACQHRLYGTADGAERWSAGHFARAAAGVMEECFDAGAVPILVGGTGLWLKALTAGLSPIPAISREAVEAAQALLDAEGQAGLRAAVLAADPAMEALNPNDTQRHLRALSVATGTGKPLSAWQKEQAVRVIEADFTPLILCPEREKLYDQCNRRFELMWEAGVIDEVAALLARGLPNDTPVMKAIGVPEIAAYLAGDRSAQDAISAAQQSTRHLAKRQMTWFRGQMPDWPSYSTHDEAAAALDLVSVS